MSIEIVMANQRCCVKYIIADVLLGALRKELRRLFDGLKTTDEELRVLLANTIIKRDALEGDAPKAAKTLVKKAATALTRKAAKSAVKNTA